MTLKCRRMNVGGKLLTNYLKEVVSYRQWNMMDEFKIIDQVINVIYHVFLTLKSMLLNGSQFVIIIVLLCDIYFTLLLHTL